MRTPLFLTALPAVALLALPTLSAQAGTTATAPAPAASAAPAAAAADATLYPIPNLTGGFWERERLLGDLGGLRSRMAENGVQIDFNMTHTYQSVWDGGDSYGWSERVSNSVENGLQDLLRRGLARAEDSKTLLGRALTYPIKRRGDVTLGDVLQQRIDRINLGTPPPGDFDDTEYQANWRLELKLDTAKMGLWPGGFLFMRTEQNFGRDINAASGALLPVNINSSLPAPGLDEVVIPHLYVTQFLNEHLAFSVGKLDPTGGDANEFAHILGDDRFLGTAFSVNPVAAMTAPYSVLGVALTILPSPDFVLALSAIDGDGTPTQSGFDTVWENKTSYIAEGRLTTHFGDKIGHQLLGLVWGSGDYAEFDQPLRAYIPGSGVTPSRSDDTWAIYYNFDQYLWNYGGDPHRGIGVFGRVGVADESTNPIAQFYSLGLGGKGVGNARPHDRWGIGWYYMKTSDELPDFLNIGDEQGGEAFYNFAITPACMITADLQLVNSAKEGVDSAIIGGLRATLRF